MLPLLLFLAVSAPARATEADSFTHRDATLEDATSALDSEMNRRMNRALAGANFWGSCDENLLFLHLGGELRAGLLGVYMVSPLEFYSNLSPSVARQSTPRDESIYSDLGVLDSAPITLYPLGALIRVGGHVIAGDKFSHFLNVGWTYYRMTYREGRSLGRAMRYGESTERGIWGLATTGVYSYADLVANFQGMRFWAGILGEDDLLGVPVEAYVRCEEEEWVLVRPFAWSDWVDAGWDEGVNCNRYARRFQDKLAAGSVRPGLETVDFRECPVTVGACISLQETYGDFSERLLAPECLQSGL